MSQSNNIIQRIAHQIQTKNNWNMSSKILIACSGGSDSMTLVNVLKKLGYTIGLAHVNFQLRGDESNRDEAFVQKFAEQHQIPFFKTNFDTKKYASENHLSIEMAARQLRYAWFEKIRIDNGYDFIATAHHLNDAVETTLLNIVKGTGIKGLKGIPFQNKKISRPLIGISKSEIETYLSENHLEFIVDSTNADNIYQRNLIRNEVIPKLEKINPNYIEAFQSLYEITNETHDLIAYFIQEKFREEFDLYQRISIEKLKLYSFQSIILYELLSPLNFNSAQIKDIIHSIDGISGKKFESPTHVLIRDRSYFLFQKKENQSNEIIQITLADLNKPIEFTQGKLQFFKCDKIEVKDATVAYFDLNKLKFPLHIRKAIAGDAFQPYGMNGKSKKLQDFFTDQKMSLFEKENQFLLLDSDESICWVIKKRSDHRFAVDAQTKDIVQFRCFE